MIRVVVTGPAGDRDVEFRLGDDAVVGDLTGNVFTAGHGAEQLVHIDGRSFSPNCPVHEAGLTAGSVLSLEASPSASPGVAELRILAGSGAGSAVALPPGRFVMGSGDGVDIAVRAAGVRERHAELRVAPSGAVGIRAWAGEDFTPVVGESILRFGSVLLGCVRIERGRDALPAMPGRRGTTSFNRPPRRMPTPVVRQFAYPEMPKPPAGRSRFSVMALVVPLLFGLVLAVLIHPRMALFALLGPVMMVGNVFEGRRRKRKFDKETAERIVSGLAELHDDFDRAVAAEIVRRHRSHPAVAELAVRASGSSLLWERRPSHPDFLQLAAGYGCGPWQPPISGSLDDAPIEFRKVVVRRSLLPTAVVPLDLRPGQVAGVAGARGPALAMARGLIAQAAVLHGPADLRIAVVTDRPDDWDWVKWLPHTTADTASGRRLLAVDAEERSRIVTLLSAGAPAAAPPGGGTADHGPADQAATLLVVDVPDLEQPSGMGLRQLLGGRGLPVAGVVVAPSTQKLPSTCTTVAEVSGNAAKLYATHGEAVVVAPAGADVAVATTIARRLARFDDPERREDGAELPTSVSLFDVLGGAPTPQSVVERWRRGGSSPRPLATIGVTEAGPLTLDVVDDGPHGLLAGTTGSGKSELLRTIVASLAVAVDPDHLTFVLIDYKGGSAFDACTGLPHTVGMVTDLDDQLAERALRCLEAELRYRERRLRDAGADDLPAYLALDPEEPMPRMLIVIDEFAAMAKELPDFMDALVDIAARGRSLGVHLLLATQRPAGVIRDNVRANTNLRIALRVQDRADSSDVLGDPRAAAIGRAQPGRGFVRLGPDELVPFQTALVTGCSAGGTASHGVAVRDFAFGMEPPPFVTPAGSSADEGPTDLENLVAAVAAAAEIAGTGTPRRPWPDPLPETVGRDALVVDAAPTRWAVPVGIVDEPDWQRQRTMWWDLENGSLALYGLTGAGTTTSLATIALALAETHDQSEVHIYVFDFDAGALAPLADLPHVGAVVAPGDRERQVRMLRHLTVELERRKVRIAANTSAGDFTKIVVMVDNFSGFTGAYESGPDTPHKEAMHRLVAEGPGVGITSILTGTRHSAIPLAVAGSIATKLVFRMADPLAAATLGLRNIPADLPVGRTIHAASGRLIQMALPHPDGLAAAVAAASYEASAEGGPAPIDELPSIVKSAQVGAALRILDDDWFLPVGIGDTDLEPVGLPLAPGDHVLVVGEPRSGKSNLLCAMGSQVAAARDDATVTAIALRRSPLRDLAEAENLVTDEEALDAAVAAVMDTPGPHLVLIDDVDAFEASVRLKELIATRRPDVHVVAAGRRDLKAQYNHWAKELCRSRIGVWLKPGPGLDGDLWSTPMPRRIPPGMPVGRGYLVGDGRVELVQTAVH